MDFFRKLFRRRPAREETTLNGVDTAPLDHEQISIEPPERPRGRILVGTSQSAGVERARNEDALLFLTGSSAGQDPIPNFGLFIVADGMGGHKSGELASAVSVKTVTRRLTQDSFFHLFDLEPIGDDLPVQDLVRLALEEANHSVVDRVPGGGTTLTMALLLGHQIIFGHVGDSRAYIVENGRMEILTRDHSLVKRLEELGQLTEAEAATHPQRNVLYKAIGQGANLEVDVFTHPVPNDGYLLICSDGLWGVIPDDEIQRIVLSNSHPQDATDELVRAANAAGGPDNISVVLVYFPVR